MNVSDEKDYIMRIIKEMVQVLATFLLGKQYQAVEFADENKYEVAGKKLKELEKMVDDGCVNEAEDALLETIDYTNKDEMLAAILFYQYIGEKDYDFLEQSNYSKDEVLDGLKMLAQKAGYGEVVELLLDV